MTLRLTIKTAHLILALSKWFFRITSGLGYYGSTAPAEGVCSGMTTQRKQSGDARPLEHAQRAQRHPLARLALRFDIDPHLAVEAVLEQPAPIGSPLG